MEGVLVPLGLFAAIVLIVYFSTSHKSRERAELFGRGVIPCLAAPESLIGSKALCWGLVIIALGLAGVVMFFIRGDMEDTPALFFIIICLSVGGALLLYHRLIGGLRDWGRRLYEKKMEALAGQRNGLKKS